ncbi:MAG: hypothetical protein GX370_04850 [Clostridia bacterium]|nr:hypothetical protein [Clostridia bacterium]
MISYYNNDDSMYTYNPNGSYDSNYNAVNNGMYNGYNNNNVMYNTMKNNNMYNGAVNNINSSVNNSANNTANCCNAMNTYGYCPYAQNINSAQNNVVENQLRGSCPYNNENYQYSPTVSCVNPYYPPEYNFRGYENNYYNGDIKIRTVSIEDIRD